MKPRFNTSRSQAALLSLCLVAVSFTSAHALDGTWAAPASINPTLTYVSSGVYTASLPLAVGDSIRATQSTAGLTNNRIFYVIANNGSGNYTLSANPGGTAITTTATAGTTATSVGLATWNDTATTTTQTGASWTTDPAGGIASGTDAIATVGNTINSPVAVKSDVTIGTINFTSTSNELNLTSSNNGATSTRAALTFDTTTGTPAINVTGTKLLRLGLSDATFGQGKLKLNGTDGLLLNVTNSTGGGSIRLEDIDFSGFTSGAGVGTITIQQGIVQTTVGNGLGATTTALNLVIGNGSTSPSLYLPELQIGNNLNISLNNLDGTSNARITGGSRTLTIGAGNGTNTGFAGIIGQGSTGVNSSVSLVKSGTGTQTLTGPIVSSGGSVTVSGGTLALNSPNSYTGVTTINSPAAVTLGANESLGFGGLIGTNQARGNVLVKAGSTLDLNGSSITEQIDLQGGTLKNSTAGAGINDGLASVSFTAGGSGLTVGAPTIIAGGGGTGAAATAFYGADATDASVVVIDNGGSGYTTAPTVAFTGGGGTGMTGTATISGDAVTAVTITNAGSGYTSVPTISFTGGGGTGAAATMPNNRWKITGIQITSAGSNYTTAPTLQIDSNSDLVIDGSDGTQPTISDRNNGGLLVGGASGTTSTLLDNADMTLVAVASASPGGRILQKTGTGTLTLAGSGDNAWFQLDVLAGNVLLKKEITGRAVNILTLAGGTASLQPGGANNKQVNNLIVNTGTFNLNGQSSIKSTVTSLTGTGGIITNNGTADSTLYIGDGGGVYTDVLTYGGVIQDGAKKIAVQVQGGTTSTREVILTGANTYSGATAVTAGKLTLKSTYLADGSAVTIGTNGTLNLDYSGTDTVGALTIGGVAQLDGEYGALSSGAANETAAITGTGRLLVVTPAAGYSSWATTNAGSQTADLDFDGDGVSNGIEYFMNASAGFTANPSLSAGAVSWTNGGNIPNGDYGTQFVVQTSSNLTTWTPVASGDTHLNNSAGSVTYTMPTPLSGKLFVRLVVTPN